MTILTRKIYNECLETQQKILLQENQGLKFSSNIVVYLLFAVHIYLHKILLVTALHKCVRFIFTVCIIWDIVTLQTLKTCFQTVSM